MSERRAAGLGRKASRAAPLAITGVALVVLVGFPLLELLRGLTEVGNAVAQTGDAGLRQPLLATAVVGGLVTLVVVTMATAAALVIERGPRRLRWWLRAGVLLPLVIPPFVSALSWVAAYGRGGLLDDAGGPAAQWIFGGVGVVAVIAINALPLAYLVIAAALATRADRDLELAARDAGATPATVLRTVTLPTLRPAIVGAGALVFVVAINAFGIPAVLGTPSGFETVTTQLYRELAFSADPAAFDRVLVLAAILVLATLLVVGAGDVGSRAGRRPLYRVETPSALPKRARRADRVAAGLVAIYALMATVVPLVALVLLSVTEAVGLRPVPANWTTANFAAAWSASSWTALGNSTLLATLAATGAVALAGVLIAAQGRRRRFTPLGTAATLTFAVPGSALAVAMILAYGPWLRDTLLLILVAYLAKFWALGHRPLAGSVAALSPDMVRAARIAGADGTTALRTIVLPMLFPAILAGWLLVFLFGLHELTMSTLLYGPDTATLAVVILNLQQLGDTTVTAALAVTLTALVVVVAVPLTYAWRSWNRAGVP